MISTKSILFSPITITFDDYSEVVINSMEELLENAALCVSDNDIECLDFNYPISFSTLTADGDIGSVLINSDRELYLFLIQIGLDDTISIEFPFSFVLSDGTGVIVENLEQLNQVIADAADSCDEDDDNDHDDDDNTDLPIGDLESLLQRCFLGDRQVQNRQRQ